MFEVLAELSEDGPSLDDFPKVWAAFERLEALLQRTAGRHADAGEYALIGYQSMPSWLRHQCGISHGAASALVARGRFLNRYRAVGDAVEAGRISAGHVTTIRRMVKQPIAAMFEEHQATVVYDVEPLTIVETEAYCNKWREEAEARADLPEPKVPDKALSTARGTDGTLLGTFTLDAAGAAQLEAALATASQWRGAGDVRNVGERNADALVDICAFFNANHANDGTPRNRPHIELIQHINHLPQEAFGNHGTNCPTCGGCTCTRGGSIVSHPGSDSRVRPSRTGESADDWAPTSRADTLIRDVQIRPTELPSDLDKSSQPDDNEIQSAINDKFFDNGLFDHDSLFSEHPLARPDVSDDTCCATNNHDSDRRSGRFRKAGTTIDGHPMPPRSMRAFLCDSVISRVAAAPGMKVDYGRETRTVPRALFRIVALRDGGCRFPGCCRKVAWTEAHHIHHWEDGGNTEASNLALLCSRHHHLIHAKGWTLVMDAAAVITITAPNGQILTSKPRGPSTT